MDPANEHATTTPLSPPTDAISALVAPDAFALMRALAPHIDDVMLAEMAAADYERDQPANRAALRVLRGGGAFDVAAFNQAREVIELTRWSMPDDPTYVDHSSGERGHWKRAWACAVLLAARCTPGFSWLEGQNQTLIQLIDSLRVLPAHLGPPAAALAACLIVTPQTPIVVEPDHEDAPFFGVGLLWLALRLTPPVPDIALLALLQWIGAMEKHRNDAEHLPYGLQPGAWLLSTTNYDLRHDAWRQLGADLARLDLAERSPEVREWVALVGTSLAG
jgi:hypothetical protein